MLIRIISNLGSEIVLTEYIEMIKLIDSKGQGDHLLYNGQNFIGIIYYQIYQESCIFLYGFYGI